METSLTLLELLTRTQPGSAERQPAFARFDRLYRPLLLDWLCRKHYFEFHEAQDVCQEVLLRIDKEIGKFCHNGNAGALRLFLKRILRYCVLEYRRRPDVRHPSTASEAADQLADPKSDLSDLFDREHDQFIVGELLKQVHNDFNPTTFAGFCKIEIESKSVPETAAELGVSENAVRLMVFRVKSRLRQQCRGFVDED